MLRRMLLALFCAAAMWGVSGARVAQAQQPPNQHWAYTYNTMDWMRFYHYPYVYYPHSFWSSDYYTSSNSLYYRYPPELRIPVYNRRWHNEYPEPRRYHTGHHFILDVF